MPTTKRRRASATKQPSIEIKVDQVRELADFLYVRSHRGGLRVALVHPAEDMNENAANALLKGLEEPPAGAMFILVSHRPAQLLPTIRSRCVAVPVPIPPRDAALNGWLSPGHQGRGALARLRRRRAAARPGLCGRGRSPQRLLKAPARSRSAKASSGWPMRYRRSPWTARLRAFGLPPKYQTGSGAVAPEKAREWLAFARRMGEDRLLCRHPLNPRLFSAAMLGAMPSDGR